MPRKPEVNVRDIESMYTVQHLTCAEIGKIIGMSRVAVWKRLQKVGITSQQGEWVSIACDQCGKEFDTTRKRWKRSKKHFCCERCYWDSLYNPNYRPNRHGQRTARDIVSKLFNLKADNVVHHHDGNNLNNHISNLKVFATQVEHLRYHRGGNARPIWDGSLLRPATEDA